MSDNPLPPPQPQEVGDDLPHSPDSPLGSTWDSSGVDSDEDEIEPHGVELTWVDVFALIVNKMVGSGIYNAPSTVLVLTGNKSTAMGLWVAGFLYTIVSMVIYLGYSAVLPYTGGELVYLDEMSSEKVETAARIHNGEPQRPREASRSTRSSTIWKTAFGDGLLAYTLYAVLFVALFNSSTNALQVGRESLVAIRPEEPPQMDTLRFIAVAALSILCLIQYWSSDAGRTLNRWMAMLKLLFLVMVFIAGAVRIHWRPFPGNGFVECAPAPRRGMEAVKAMLLVIFSFEGWENATFVTGEIAPGDQSALRIGFMSAVMVVGFLYIGVVAVYLYAVPYTPVAIQFSPVLFGNSRAAYQLWAVFITFSSLGSMNSIIYTFSRIKQCIGVGNIFPWSHFWASDSPDLKDHRNYDGDKSPLGGLWLHWIMSVVLIAISAAIPNMLESTSLPGLLQTYAHCFILIFVGFGALRLPSRARNLKPTENRTPGSLDRKISDAHWPWRRPLYILASLYALANLIIVILTAVKPYAAQDGILDLENWNVNPDNKRLTCSGVHSTDITFGIPIALDRVSALDGWILPTVSLAAVALGLLYYFLLFKLPGRRSLANIAGVYPKITHRPTYRFGHERVRRFGSRRIIKYCPVVPNSNPNFVYWVLGGQSQYQNDTDALTPLRRIRRKKAILKRRIRAAALKPIHGGGNANTHVERQSAQGRARIEE